MKNVPINELQVGDCVEVQRDLNYSATGKPWKGSIGVITNVDNYYFPNVTYMVDFGSEMCGIPAHDDNIKQTMKGMFTKGGDRFVMDTHPLPERGDQLIVNTVDIDGRYYLNICSVRGGELAAVLCAVDPEIILEVANRIEPLAIHNKNI